jgi:hypothetical protein
MLKYYYQYEDKKPRMAQTDALAFGSAIHEALEELHGIVSKSGLPPQASDYERVLRIFMNSAVDQGLTNQALYEEGRQHLINRLDTVNPKENIIGLELKFDLETPNGTPFTGHIDKLIEVDSSTVAVVDYKTSRMALTQDEADNDIQLSMYDLAVSMLYPKYTNVISVLDYIRLRDVLTYRTPEQRSNFSEFLDCTYDKICRIEEKDVFPSLNTFCSWCDSKSYCDMYQKVIADPDLLIPPTGELTDEEFVNVWEQVVASRKILDNRYNELKSEAYNRLSANTSVKSSTKELVKSQTSRASYDPKTLFNVIGKDKFFGLVNVNKTATDRVLKDNPDAATEIERTASFSFNLPSFRIKKLKNEDG